MAAYTVNRTGSQEVIDEPSAQSDLPNVLTPKALIGSSECRSFKSPIIKSGSLISLIYIKFYRTDLTRKCTPSRF